MRLNQTSVCQVRDRNLKVPIIDNNYDKHEYRDNIDTLNGTST